MTQLYKTIDRESAKRVAYELFTRKKGKVDFFVNPQTGELEILLTGEFPSKGYEYVFTQVEGQIRCGQELCETDQEIKDLFEQWWRELGDQWIMEIEMAWNDD